MSARSALLVLLVLLCTGCSGGGSAPAPRQPPPTSESPRYGAPTVLKPLDVSAVAPAPCASLLTKAELETLGFEAPGQQRTVVDVQECSWSDDEYEQLAMAVDTDRDLLADTYRSRIMPIFVPSQIEGLPAVRQRMAPNDNTCTVTTGLGPRQALETEWSGLSTRQTSDPCERAEEAIALVIRKLPPQR